MAKKYDPQAGSLFKKRVPQMPEGYYSGDKPNPNLRAFVEQHIKERPYDHGTDRYNVQAFSDPINAKREHDIFNMHAYWSKKAHEAIKSYIEHYTSPGDLVLDQFCGSGGTALSALSLGRKAVAIDRSPAATFITNGFCSSTDLEQLDREYNNLLRNYGKKISDLYRSTCHKCGADATIHYQVYSMTFQCLKCLRKVPIVRCKSIDGSSNANTCPYCGDVIKTSQEKKGYQLVETWVYCSQACSGRRSIQRRFDDTDQDSLNAMRTDIDNLKSLQHVPVPDWAPAQPFPIRTRSHTLHSRGVHNMRDLYTQRNYLALCALMDGINNITDEYLRHKMLFIFTAICLKTSKMMGYNADSIGRIRKDSLQAQFTFKDVNVLDFFKEAYSDIVRGFANINSKIGDRPALIISTQSATHLAEIPANSIDYIFTDPPYGDKVQFWEMNQVWENWLTYDVGWEEDEIIVCKARGISEEIWYTKMVEAFREAYRILKPGRWMTLTYHDISTGTWHLVQDAASDAGFIPDSSTKAVFIETRQKAEKQYRSDININKRDLVINFRKPKSGEAASIITITDNEDKTTFNEKVHQIIRDYLGANPGSTKDHVYDEVVSRMVRSGQMEAHDFNELLEQVAEEAKIESGKNGGGRWYLKETELVIADAAENAREDAAAEKLGAFIKGFLKKNPGDEGVHYSDLFEHYIYAVKDKPRRQLAEFLPDYFYKTAQGTWRLPASEEEEKAKHEARVKGLGRRVKRYIAQLELGAAIPDHERPNDATLAEWIRHCKRAGLYEQGKLLYEKGGLNPDNLPEEAMVGVEEDYQVCARMLAREASEPKRRGRKKAEE
jgi:DNA modification methylase/predicted RNA-binding Zn-ribbon protein involved in translation (DUF1610 family)